MDLLVPGPRLLAPRLLGGKKVGERENVVRVHGAQLRRVHKVLFRKARVRHDAAARLIMFVTMLLPPRFSP